MLAVRQSGQGGGLGRFGKLRLASPDPRPCQTCPESMGQRSCRHRMGSPASPSRRSLHNVIVFPLTVTKQAVSALTVTKRAVSRP